MRLFLLLCLLFVAFLSACSSPQTRIDAHRAAFEQFPPEIQEKVRTGRVDIGFTPEMVRMAWGDPARQLTRKTEKGELEVWIYTNDEPQFSVGLGFGSVSRRGGVGVGMTTGTGSYEPDERARVEFREGRVESVEYRK